MFRHARPYCADTGLMIECPLFFMAKTLMTSRKTALTHWLEQYLDNFTLTDHLGDASFRSYWRVKTPNGSLLAMDAPVDLEDCEPFVAVANSFEKLGLKVPHIHAQDLSQGFILLDDFGDDILYRVLNKQNVDILYKRAIDEIHTLQRCEAFNGEAIPAFDRVHQQRELDEFKTWLLKQYLGVELNEATLALLHKTDEILLSACLAQPQVCIHRDYHSKNLLRLANNDIGIIDFQDAMIGGVCYDLVSLVRDCYVDWPAEQVYGWLNYFIDGLHSRGLYTHITKPEFEYWFDLTGMQRHLKASFIFARKYLRDNHDGYLKYLNRTLNYAEFVSAKYPELHDFNAFLHETVLPKLRLKVVA